MLMSGLAVGPVGGAETDILRLSLEDVREYPHSDYSHNDIERAGKTIATATFFSTEVPSEIKEAFVVANNWRDAHAYPMRSIHSSIRAHMRINDLDGITAARLKRMQAIRRKLRRIGLGLDQLQDLGGCRVILSTIADTRALVKILRERLPSSVIKEDDYIARPKKDGYRSHHIIYGFRRPEPTPFDDRKVELQIRTSLQHSWATTVEAVGLFRGEELKNQQGDKNWLRFFALMSAEFAEAERCAPVPGTPDPLQRRTEIKQLGDSLKALTVLESVSNGFRGPDLPLAPGYIPSHYLIRYDHDKKTVNVEPYNTSRSATASYDKAEEILRAGEEKDVVVLVEVDKINNLKAAYPNYFGDVELFKRQLRDITIGKSAVEYSIAPRQPAPKPRQENGIDPSWLRGHRFPKPSLRKGKRKKGKRS